MRRADQPQQISAECVPNIGARGRARRRAMGAFWTLATGAMLVVLSRQQAGPLMFLVVAPFAGIAALNFFQVREKT